MCSSDLVKKTNRLVTVEEGWPYAGIGSEVAMQICEHAFDWLDAPPKRVCGADVPMPYAANLERLSVPRAPEIVAGVRAALGRAQAPDAPVYYWQSRFFSADYYGGGRVRTVQDASALARELAARRDFTLVVPERRRASLPEDIAEHLQAVGTVDSMELLAPQYPAEQGSP